MSLTKCTEQIKDIVERGESSATPDLDPLLYGTGDQNGLSLSLSVRIVVTYILSEPVMYIYTYDN